ncbi:hypothetical protein [Engelhardtia mirabilis]|uniref:SGNH hydrolase-type esterase domain-containing protein n=1 Tax=Engelhardtia mirabilis TaxID=2528011 RepID=A0A518BS63_9BACT|nr:hypothetical protein Pla133_49350 [Planctomycetes bacterium Pla133]QDV04139.1 hypothetical protein Pla86_49330 [Planctomycetes bacterium Pla86]
MNRRQDSGRRPLALALFLALVSGACAAPSATQKGDAGPTRVPGPIEVASPAATGPGETANTDAAPAASVPAANVPAASVPAANVPAATVPAIADAPVVESGAGSGAAPVAPATLERIALLGASATGGFNLNAELGRAASMADFLELALVTPPAALLDASDLMLFSSPLDRGGEAIAAAAAFGPTATLAVDLPFWFVHGPYRGDRDRRDAFEWLLNSLDGEFGDLVLGTVPTMGPEVAEWMVAPSLRAKDETVAWANGRLAQWAAEREHVVIVPMAEFLADLRAGRDLTLRGQTFEGEDVEEFLQGDGLHPTVVGTAALLMLVLDGLDRHAGGSLAGELSWDVEELAGAVEDAQ